MATFHILSILVLNLIYSIYLLKSYFNLKGLSLLETCADGIKNQGELDVDCGGPCHGCPGETKWSWKSDFLKIFNLKS